MRESELLKYIRESVGELRRRSEEYKDTDIWNKAYYYGAITELRWLAYKRGFIDLDTFCDEEFKV